MEKEIKLLVTEECEGDRLDVFCCENADLSRSHVQKLIAEGMVARNGKPAKASKPVVEGDEIVITVPELRPIALQAEDIPIHVVYEDEYLAVIDKQQGLVVHPAAGNESGTLVNALLFRFHDLSGINGELRPGIVHRLDKDTSGLMMVAKNDTAHRSLAEQIAKKECRRVYYALLEGVLKEDCGIVDQPLGRNPADRKKMAIVPNGKRAETHWNVLKRYRDYTLCEFELKTGRTHQIRVHAKFLGHPVVGDVTYGYAKQKFRLNGQLLHSKRITFTHPVTHREMTFESELPDYFLKVLKSLK